MSTNTFRFSEVEEGFSSKLSVFDKPKMDTAVIQHTKERVYPTSAVTQGGPIMFKIDPSMGYIDGANSTLTMAVSIKKPDGTSVKGGTAAVGDVAAIPGDLVALANLPIHTAFNQIVTSMSGTELNSEEGTLHAYKQMIDVITFTSKEYKETVAKTAGYYQDTGGAVGNTNPGTADNTNMNTGLMSRYELTRKGDIATFTSNLGLEWLEGVERYIVNGTTIYITLYQAPDKVRLLAEGDDTAYYMKIEDIYLTLCVVHVRPEVLITHSEEFNSGKNALYAHPKTSMRSHVMPGGCKQFRRESDTRRQSTQHAHSRNGVLLCVCRQV